MPLFRHLMPLLDTLYHFLTPYTTFWHRATFRHFMPLFDIVPFCIIFSSWTTYATLSHFSCFRCSLLQPRICQLILGPVRWHLVLWSWSVILFLEIFWPITFRLCLEATRGHISISSLKRKGVNQTEGKWHECVTMCHFMVVYFLVAQHDLDHIIKEVIIKFIHSITPFLSTKYVYMELLLFLFTF